MRGADSQTEGLGLYLSVPFCRSKCTFCNFASGVYPASELPRYVQRLIADLAGARAHAATYRLALPETLDTIYLGGGTPSIFAPEQLRLLFTVIRRHFAIERGAEVTLEAAPSMLEDDLLGAAAELGVTRISFGVQTFVDSEARATGRLHAATQALDDLRRARRAGMSVSVDLIAGLPGQTEASWRHSLDTLVEAAPEHASIYMLEVDADSRLGGEMLLGGTRYGAGITPSEDAVADFYSEACTTLAAAGLAQYEISNFARTGVESRHNQKYWQRRPYLGLGLDAHSMLRAGEQGFRPASVAAQKHAAADGSDAGSSDHQDPRLPLRAPCRQAFRGWGQAVRFGTTDDLKHYLDSAPGGDSAPGDPYGDLHWLSPAEELEEAWFLGMRCNAGVSPAALAEEFGPAAVEPYLSVLASLEEDGLIELNHGKARLTDRGRMLSNDVFACFLDVHGCTKPDRYPSGTIR